MMTVLVVLLFTACKHDRYVDLTSGAHVDLVKDEKTGTMVDSKTHKPVEIYVDTKTNDTIYGPTGKVINGYIVKTSDGKYKYEGDEYKYKNGDYKVKVEGDEVKIKNGDKKIKIENGERKVKKD
jgi:hypothetical protein